MSLAPWFTLLHTSDSNETKTGPPNTGCPLKQWGSDRMPDSGFGSPESFDAKVDLPDCITTKSVSSIRHGNMDGS